MSLRIHQPSLQSLYVEVLRDEIVLANATAFVARIPDGKCFLVTNRHVVTGRNQDTGATLDTLHRAIPNKLRIFHNACAGLGEFTQRTIHLYDSNFEDNPQWIEHPGLGAEIDVVLLPITEDPQVKLFPYTVRIDTHKRLSPSNRVSVIGFPFGQRTGQSMAVWATGFVASETEVDHGNQPVFLIDCQTRAGQSGAPVIFSPPSHGYLTYEDGTMLGYIVPEFLGVYSGRINEKSDLGKVWKPNILADMLSEQIPTPTPPSAP